MKILSLICFLLALTAIGCTTVQTANGPVRITDTNIIDKTAFILKGAVTSSIVIAVEKERAAGRTGVETYLRLASAVVDKVIVSGDSTPATLSKALAALPLKELQTPEAKTGLAIAEAAYGVYFEDYVKGKINGNYAAVALLTAFRDGINDALPALR